MYQPIDLFIELSMCLSLRVFARLFAYYFSGVLLRIIALGDTIGHPLGIPYENFIIEGSGRLKKTPLKQIRYVWALLCIHNKPSRLTSARGMSVESTNASHAQRHNTVLSK